MSYNEHFEWIKRRNDAIAAIGPICKAYGITKYDLVYEDGREHLKLESTVIDCTTHSVPAIVDELIRYISRCGLLPLSRAVG